MTVLAIDTSNFSLGIALAKGDQVIGEYITNIKKNHSLRVMPAIERLVGDCDLKTADLKKIVVARGPGSYTGVRIGVTIAKTLAWTLNIPLAGVSSLEFLAANGRYFTGIVSPLFDARRGQIFTGLYRFNGNRLETILEDTNMLATEWAGKIKQYNQPVLFIGNDTPLHKEALQNILGDAAFFAPPALYNPRPGELALLGMEKEGEDIHSFVPNYVRLAEAEAKWLGQQRD
ncbi:tRNA (adenosine(37)-N6)-threonylcarbamoyltransferase complex dimerization subunit type 1 TsaB [Peribacillus glennii]|uniref:tRNA (Adenosine(37)-N6)-threonylcarbamoyltransferase complex dimerization subunit type 1 TsaB n=1 Tax=Peribacillus glennii TaxID=2303991 RepID=A0A372LDA5_9BACI|nr:tRNA (adenosine(37)-N6)-threonylcarbamoyltransferase complex dimerization subunit type 1 TsaB [Peribacillus glennii]RFU63134.1 tRNA (adenosine(37)-N6)-threonylcarbamoyltransferase complex dimerization subunit type 1 TsaB [Peribacillus glennii]